MPDLFRQADAFLFTSLRDTSGSVVLEAMAHALLIITLDHQGVGEFVPSDAGIKVPVTTPGKTAATLAQEIRRLGASMEMRVRMGEAAWAYARTQTWDRRAAQMSRWYHQCLSRYI
jgi:glycosyltransferase involved in cell wall biosynthesis